MTDLPLIQFDNLFSKDPTGQKLWSYWLKKETYAKYKSQFERMGKNAAEATPLAAIADIYSPQLSPFNAVGERIDKVTYHPAYQKMRELSYGSDIISLKYDPAFLKTHTDERHLLGFAIAYYFAQTETGLFCPICMTDALARVLEKNNTHPMAQKALAHLTTANVEELWEGAMFLTEKQGGSDVGANRVQAVFEDNKWKLFGDKWFCSNADAKVALALARMPGDEGSKEQGTRGLGLFLVLREHPQQNHKSWSLNRLKTKLGVRSMASGEITFNGTEAYLIAGADEGFKVMTEMVNMSRLYNAVSSIGIIRRSVMEACAFGEARQAFGKKLIDLPLWRACLADLNAENLGMMLLIFETTRQLDKSDGGNEESTQLTRWLTPLSKALSGKLAVFAASEAMELIGGNAYIEEHILPRLLRDAQVLPIWEGTTNIQSLDLLRVLKKNSPKSFIQRCEVALKSSTSPSKKEVEQRLENFKSSLGKLAALNAEDVQRASRRLLEDAGRIMSLCLLLEAGENKDLKEICQAAALRLLARPETTSALGGFQAKELASTEDILLKTIL